MPIYCKRRGDRMYLYEQKSYREGGRVKTWTRYLGPLGGIVEANRTRKPPKPLRDEAQEHEDRAMAAAEWYAAKIDAWQREQFGETALERRAREAEEARFKPAEFLEKTQSVQSEPTEQNSGDELNEGKEKGPD